MQTLQETLALSAAQVALAHKSLAPKRPRFYPVNITPNGMVKHRRPKGGWREVPLFRGEDRAVVRASARLAEKKPSYLREGGPVA